jgi:hypothetical protein
VAEWLRHVASTHDTQVQFLSSALRAASISRQCTALLMRVVGDRGPRGAPRGRGGTVYTALSKSAGPEGSCGFVSRRPYSMATGGIWQTRRLLVPEISWFEARVASSMPLVPAHTRPSYGQAVRVSTGVRLACSWRNGIRASLRC